MVTVVVVTATMVTTAVGEDELSAVYGGGEPTVVVAAVVLRGIPPKTSFTLLSILSIGYTTLFIIVVASTCERSKILFSGRFFLN